MHIKGQRRGPETSRKPARWLTNIWYQLTCLKFQKFHVVTTCFFLHSFNDVDTSLDCNTEQYSCCKLKY